MDDIVHSYTQNDICSPIVNSELAYLASEGIDFDVAPPQVKLAWLLLMFPMKKLSEEM